MTEPSEIADRVEEIVDGVWHWRISNANIGGAVSSSHALAAGDGCVLIDPVHLADDALASLPRPSAIVLTAKVHQRSAWRYRAEFGIDVWLPEDAPPADEEPDRRYAEGDELPGSLLAIRTPGPEWPHYSFLLESPPGILFVSDLIASEGGELRFVPPEYHDNPEETRHSTEQLLRLPFTVLCLAHGTPITEDPKAALRALLG